MKQLTLLLCAASAGGLAWFSDTPKEAPDQPTRSPLGLSAEDLAALDSVVLRPEVELPLGQPVYGNSQRLWERYQSWKTQVSGQASGPQFVFPLKSLCAPGEPLAAASGTATVDLASGKVSATISGAPSNVSLKLSLVDDRGEGGGNSLLEAQDVVLEVGGFVAGGEGFELEASLAGRLPAGFELDQIFVSESSVPLETAAVLFGGPTLFQRLYANEIQAEKAAADQALLLGLALPVQLGGPLGIGPIGALVAQGEGLFFNTTFKGNGRTCGTCHPADNNLTIDPDFISKLNNKDPLFVAEFVPALTFELNGSRRFENPVLMRKLGLIAENLDGFMNLKKMFVMRSVPHTFAQTVSIQAGNGITPPDERTGWSGDGAPHGLVNGIPTSGRLFDFAVGAVIQHFPKTTNRINGVDFIMPTNAELVAMEAFQLSLGRQVDFDLNVLTFNDPDTETGKILYQQSACNKCHPDAGSGQPNFNFDTGVEEFLINNPDPTGEPRPADGGFGTDPNGLFPAIPVANTGIDPNKPAGSFGNGDFNTPSIVEAADTGPFFHNNIIWGGIEEAIDFYRSAEFAQAQGFTISFPGNGREQVGKFLRSINSIDNIDTGVEYATRAHDACAFFPTSIFDAAHHAAVNLFLRLALADIDDTIQVLSEVGLNPTALKFLKEAKCYFQWAMAPMDWDKRRDLIKKGIIAMGDARMDIGN
jgi:hypothetical protein